MKKIVLILIILTLIPTASYGWINICLQNKLNPYCKDVGKDAYNATGSIILKDIRLGRIIGVIWRPKGSLISNTSRISPRSAFYFIIDDGFGPKKAFLRECREIDAR